MAGSTWKPFKGSPAPIGEPYQKNFTLFIRKTANSNNQVEVLVTTRSSSDTPDGGFASLHSTLADMRGHFLMVEFVQGAVKQSFTTGYDDLITDWYKYTTVANTGDHVNTLATIAIWSWETEAEPPDDPKPPKETCSTSSTYGAKETGGLES